MEKRETSIILLSVVILLLIGIVANYSDEFGISGKSVLTLRGGIKVAANTPTDAEVLHTKEVTFKWRSSGGEQKKYQLIVDDNVAFDSSENYYGYTSQQKTIILSEEGTYFWRIRLHDGDGWGKWSEVRQFSVYLKRFTCDDGTEAYACSETKPYYCNGLKLVKDCKKCGCPSNGFCQTDGTCITSEISRINCVDGTSEGECSSTKPVYCNSDGNLVKRSSICGCPDGTNPDESGIGCEIKIEAPMRGFSLFRLLSRYLGN